MEEYIMFGSDKPIENIENDRLNRKSFSQQLANAILSYKSQDNFTIGLCGRWGTGKTSIINMVTEEIACKTFDLSDKPIIVKFNPWNYSDTAQLIKQFFNTIMSEIEINSSGKELKKVASAIEKYSDILEYSQYIPIIGKYLKPIKGLLRGFGKKASDVAKQKDSLENVKTEVINALKNQNQKLIVIIDDIDRLNNEQIRLIFQLVNCVAGFPNMIYLLSFDKTVVVRALEDEQKCNGEEYLEKIIQVPFDVPEAKKSDVHNLLFEKLDNIWFDEIPCRNFEKEYWSKVYANCLSPLLNNIRDVNRVINVYKFKYGLLHSETNCIDLLAITAFQVCAPGAFEWIKNNINRLTGSGYGLSTSGIDQKKHRAEMIEEFERATDNAEFMLEALQVMFPKFAWQTCGYYYSGETEDQLRYMQRISCADRTSLYFNLSLEDVKVSQRTVAESINTYNSEELDRLINDLISNGFILQYAKELNAHAKDIPADRRKLLLQKLLYLQTFSFEDEKVGILNISPIVYCEKCCWSILKTMDTVNLCSMLKDLVISVENQQFDVITDMIVKIENSYGRIGNSQDVDFRVISEEQLIDLENPVLLRIKKIHKSSFLFDSKSPWSKYWFWKYKEPESLQSHIIDGLKNKKNIPYYLAACASVWTGGKTQGWGFKKEHIEEYISIDKAYESLIGLKNTDYFSGLPYSIKETSIAFYLWYNSDRKEHDSISKENVDSMISEWEK